MVDLIRAMGIVVLAWAVYAGALLGLGLLARRAFGLRGLRPGDAAPAFWTGYALSLLVLQLWHLAFPVGVGAAGLVLALGGIGLLLDARPLAERLRDLMRRRPRLCLLFVGVALLLANRAVGPGDDHDSGLYHFQVIRWTNEHAVVPGLANLATPYGLNNASLLFAAMVNTGPLAGLGHHVANSLLLAALAGAGLAGVAGLTRRDADAPVALRVVQAALLPVAAMLAFAPDVSSPTTDLPAGVLMLTIGVLLCRQILLKEDEPRREAWRAVVIMVLCSAAVAVKLSAGAFALSAWLIAAGVLFTRLRSDGKVLTPPLLRAAVAGVALSTLIVGPWLARGAIVSGYPLYPSRAVALDVDWRVPPERVDHLRDVIANHMKGELPLWLSAKIEATPLSFYAPLMRPPFNDRMEIEGWNWVRPWFFTLPVSAPMEVALPSALIVLSGAGWIVVRRRGRKGERVLSGSERRAGLWLVAIPPLLGLALWFLTAPGGRYAWPMLWLLAGLVPALVVLRTEPSRRARLAIAAGWVVVAAAALPYNAVRIKVIHAGDPLATLPFYGPGSEGGFHPTPVRELERIELASGLVVNVPSGAVYPDDGDAEGWDVVWKAPLPAVAWPPLDPRLEPRRPGDLASGFRTGPEPGS